MLSIYYQLIHVQNFKIRIRNCNCCYKFLFCASVGCGFRLVKTCGEKNNIQQMRKIAGECKRNCMFEWFMALHDMAFNCSAWSLRPGTCFVLHVIEVSIHLVKIFFYKLSHPMIRHVFFLFINMDVQVSLRVP